VRLSSLALVVLAISSSQAWTRAATGDDSSLAQAQALFDRGSHAADAGRYAEACPELEQARALVAGIGVTLYLGECYEQTGRFLEAWRQFRDAERLASARGDPRARIARERSSRLWAKLAKLVLVTPADTGASRAQITDNGVSVDASDLDGLRPVDPGVHRIEVTMSGRLSWATTVTVHAGETADVQVPVLRVLPTEALAPRATNEPLPSPATTLAPSPTPLPDARHHAPEARRLVGAGVMGLGAVGILLGATFGIEAQSKLNDSNSSGHCKPDDHCDAAGLAERSDALTDATVSTSSFIAAGVCLVGGAALFLLAPGQTTMGFTVGPRADGGASVAVRGVW